MRVDEHLEEYVTSAQLIAIGWNKEVVTIAMVKQLNRVLVEYGITDINSIRHFVAQASHESNDWYKEGYGDGLIEMGSDSYLRGKEYWPYIGAGYIHLTWKANYQAFSDYLKKTKGIDDPLIMSDIFDDSFKNKLNDKYFMCIDTDTVKDESNAIEEIFNRYRDDFETSNDNFYFTKNKFIIILPINSYFRFATDYEILKDSMIKDNPIWNQFINNE